MLKIRPEQMRVFQSVADASFLRRVAQHLRESYAESPVQLPGGATTVARLPEAILLEMVSHGVARARGYGMSYESSLAVFVVIMFTAAPNFDEHPLIRRILADRSIPPDARLDQALERISEQNWEAVKQNYAASAWNLKQEK